MNSKVLSKPIGNVVIQQIMLSFLLYTISKQKCLDVSSIFLSFVIFFKLHHCLFCNYHDVHFAQMSISVELEFVLLFPKDRVTATFQQKNWLLKVQFHNKKSF